MSQLKDDFILTDSQAANLRAFVGRVVPDDDGTPGAIVAGVDMHLRAMLARDFHADVPLYRTFLDALGADFAGLPPSAQDDRLQQIEQSMEHGKAFGLLVEHVQEGWYISPVAWRLIGWEVTG